MIISASRRTDIPNYYADWFIQRLRDGCCMVRNPTYPNQVSKVRLNTTLVDCIVFWSKNPYSMIKYLDEIDEMGFKYYFHYTLNAYGQDMEPKLPNKLILIDHFMQLSDKIGKNKVIWRYDPIFSLQSGRYNINWHIGTFEIFAKKLHKYTNKCIVSLFDQYRKNKAVQLKKYTIDDIEILMKALSEIATTYNLKLETCAEEIDLTEYNISKSKCIDSDLISNIAGYDIEAVKDKSQRGECGCIGSVDIGEYDSCINGCVYCYANNDFSKAFKRYNMNNISSGLLIGRLKDGDFVRESHRKSCRKTAKTS